MVTEPSSICTKWNRLNAIGSTGSRSTWFTCSTSIVATASSYSECMARIRRRRESATSRVAGMALLLGELGLGRRRDVGGVGTAADVEGDAPDHAGERERRVVVVDDR